MDIVLILAAAAAFASSGLSGLVLPRSGRRAERTALALLALGSLFGLVGAGWSVASPGPGLRLAWSLPVGSFAVELDGVALVFLLPVLIVPTLGALYGLDYWRQDEHPDTGLRLRSFFGLLAGAMVLLVLAADGVLFLIAWEIIALSAFFLITTDDADEAACCAGWVYLVATHLGTMCLLAMFGLLNYASGSFLFEPLGKHAIEPAIATAVFALAVVGFGLKAGIVPLHVWLPAAHAGAPSHVSAVLSGVMLKMGVYGIVRIAGLLPDPPVGWGVVLLALGTATALYGIAQALAQGDLKRLLAYSSIENIGIIVLGLGLALVGRSLGKTDWIVFGLGGALLHVWNHSLFKPLLFLAGGSMIHAAQTRQLDRMGGLAKRMPTTGAAFLLAAAASCALPPLNGFVSELAIYLGLFSAAGAGPGAAFPLAALAAPALALVGAWAVAAMVKAVGVALLGEPRTEAAAHAHEAGRAMLAPMALLAAGCLVLGLFPSLAAPCLDRAAADWRPASAPLPHVGALMPLAWISGCGVALAIACVSGAVWLRRRVNRAVDVGTWDCGYIAPTARMQYTAASFSQMLVSLFGWALRPEVERPRIEGVFAPPARLATRPRDAFLDRLALPAAAGFTWVLDRAAAMRRRPAQVHLLFILVMMLLLLLCSAAV
jgi:hydrogenase-4 component B